jgi:hypothetical protein
LDHQCILFLVKSRTSCPWIALLKCWVIRWFVQEFCYISTPNFILFVSNCGVGDWFLTHILSLGMRDFHFPGTGDCGLS